MLEPFTQNLTARRTNDFRTRLTLSEAISGGPPAPVDLTGCEIYMDIRTAAGAATAYVSVNSVTPNVNGGTITLVTPASGIIEVFIPREDWAGDPESAPDASKDQTLVYELVVVKAGGNLDVMTYGEGTLTLKKGVTVAP